jgi:HD-like signal output (HDOD) protein
MVDRDDCSFEELTGRIEHDQSLSARLLQVANSPMYAGLERIRNLPQAISRLGMQETRNLLYAVLAENLFKTRSPNLMRMMARLRARSVWLRIMIRLLLFVVLARALLFNCCVAAHFCSKGDGFR